MRNLDKNLYNKVYKKIGKCNFVLFCIVTLHVFYSLPSSAHMMVAQHGTLNVVEGGIFMVLSLPVSSFDRVDDDNDGKLSTNEFNKYRKKMAEVIKKQVVLSKNKEKLLLQGLMMTPVLGHGNNKKLASQIIIMGRFKIDTKALNNAYLNGDKLALTYQVNLFGKAPDEKLLKITATNKNDSKVHRFSLSPKKNQISLFNEAQ